MTAAPDRLHRLLRGLRETAPFEHPVREFRVIETHISCVVLTGPYAYKFKKPVDLGFVDFSTLDRREHFCHEELRLNRRLAPALYLDVVAVYGTPEQPAFRGTGTPLEYAVRMVQFPQDARLDRVVARDGLPARRMDHIAREVAAFHARVEQADPESPYGTPERVSRSALDNFSAILSREVPLASDPRLEALRQWTVRTLEAQAGRFAERRSAGRVRACHGDMHLANMALAGGQVQVFDCLEFNPALSCIDVVSEVAFVVMDLAYRGRPDLGWRFLSSYMEATGDYEGLAVLRHYMVYRAMVRTKVACIQAAQPETPRATRAQDLEDAERHLVLAESFTRQPETPLLVLTHGLSGSGKSRLARRVGAHLGAVRIRSDVERKRLFFLRATEQGGAGLDEDIYSPEATRRTYGRLADYARMAIDAGYPVVLDATFLDQERRDEFHRLAETLGVPLRILHARAPRPVLAARIARRAGRPDNVSDADLGVLAQQERTAAPLTPRERSLTVSVDTSAGWDAAEVAARLWEPASE